MRAAVFHGPGDIRVVDVPRPHAGPGEAVVMVTATTSAAPMHRFSLEEIGEAYRVFSNREDGVLKVAIRP
jgi:threonine dehydrogenase-like Zn-dependent dehydrogenase